VLAKYVYLNLTRDFKHGLENITRTQYENLLWSLEVQN